jgi:hypothetical protein
MNYSKLIDAIINEQANDAKEFVTSIISEKIDAQVDAYRESIKESLFGLSREDVAIEVTEENIEELLDTLSEEDLEELAAILEAEEAKGLTEEELNEISKERVKDYVVKSVTDREKQNQNWGNAQKSKMKAGDNLRNAKKAGPDHKYGETDASHSERVGRLSKKYDSAKKSVADADRKQTNRNVGLHRAGKVLAKD